MSLNDEINKLENAIRALHDRLRSVETGNKVLPAKETIYGRMDREREERTQKVQDKQSAKPHESLAGSARPVSKKRWDEVKQRNQHLPSPNSHQKAEPPPTQNSMDVIFACWKGNKICLTHIHTGGPPSPLP